jgi:F-type H+-transporting ATPase subunit b
MNLIQLLSEESGTINGVPDVVKDLFPNLPNFIAHVISTIIILLVLAKLVYKPFRKTVENRRTKINELLDDAAYKQTLANKDRHDAKKILNDAKKESQDILQSARLEADRSKTSIISSARDEASNIQAHAKNAINQERKEAQDQIKQQVISLAFTAAEKVLEQNVSGPQNEKLIKEFIENIDK